jgi:acyl-CoA thioesterase II
VVTATVDDPLARWLALLDVERTGPDTVRAHHPDGGPARTFGGQLLAQGLYAAGLDLRSRPTLRPSAVHAAFLRAGDATADLGLHIDERRDGRASAWRSVRIVQHGTTVCKITASFASRSGDRRAVAVRRVAPPPPDGAGPAAPLTLRGLPQPVELVSEGDRSWVRAPRTGPADPLVQACLMAWASDLTAFDAAGRLPHVAAWGTDLTRVSLDHHLWFHVAADITGWLQLDQTCVPGEAGSTFTRGHYLDEDGRLVASLAQEGLLRRRRAA